MTRMGLIMEPEPGNPMEVEGVLNPAAARGPDGHLYLFPRLVAQGNYSRIGIARVAFNSDGDPVGAERLGIALEPQVDYELRPGGGGCEDPRVTFYEPLKIYVMTYTALSSRGPRIAIAISKDLFLWDRVGLARFRKFEGIEFAGVDDKDAVVFPTEIFDAHGRPTIGLLHRPLFPGTRPEETSRHPASRIVDLDRECIWISYCTTIPGGTDHQRIRLFNEHHRLALPEADWESLKIGSGTPPILTRHGWMIVYHGVCKRPDPVSQELKICYSAGVMILAKDHPHRVLYRSTQPVLTPELPAERIGAIANVVFPTGIDRRDDLGTPNRFDVYYGMADDRIGVARLDVPDQLPTKGP